MRLACPARRWPIGLVGILIGHGFGGVANSTSSGVGIITKAGFMQAHWIAGAVDDQRPMRRGDGTLQRREMRVGGDTVTHI